MHLMLTIVHLLFIFFVEATIDFLIVLFLILITILFTIEVVFIVIVIVSSALVMWHLVTSRSCSSCALCRSFTDRSLARSALLDWSSYRLSLLSWSLLVQGLGRSSRSLVCRHTSHRCRSHRHHRTIIGRLLIHGHWLTSRAIAWHLSLERRDLSLSFGQSSSLFRLTLLSLSEFSSSTGYLTSSIGSWVALCIDWSRSSTPVVSSTVALTILLLTLV